MFKSHNAVQIIVKKIKKLLQNVGKKNGVMLYQFRKCEISCVVCLVLILFII